VRHAVFVPVEVCSEDKLSREVFHVKPKSLTLFRLGSISKITATAILQLSERGKLDLGV
jgi:CubicO group peptidase (beta-lactamase class C family)